MRRHTFLLPGVALDCLQLVHKVLRERARGLQLVHYLICDADSVAQGFALVDKRLLQLLRPFLERVAVSFVGGFTGNLYRPLPGGDTGSGGEAFVTWQQKGMATHPVNIVNEMIAGQTEYNVTMEEIKDIERNGNPLATYTEAELRRFIRDNEANVDANRGGRIILGLNEPHPTVRDVSAAELRDFLDEARARLSVLESPTPEVVGGNPDFNLDDFTPYESEKDRKAREAAERRAQVKARKDFRDALNDTKGDWEAASPGASPYLSAARCCP